MIQAASQLQPACRRPMLVILGLLKAALLALLLWLGRPLLAVLLGIAVMLTLAALGEQQG